LTFRSPERTLTAEEVNAACDRLRARLREQLGIEFRE
jgi:phenylalanyl-tRNA synthetase beta subunit